jgi:hypothetical protein
MNLLTLDYSAVKKNLNSLPRLRSSPENSDMWGWQLHNTKLIVITVCEVEKACWITKEEKAGTASDKWWI